MRYVPISKLKSGMLIGQDIHDVEGRLLLARHLILNDEYIKNLEHLGMPGIYCDDEISEDIEIKEVLRPQLKRDAVKLIRDLFSIGGDKPASQKELQDIVMCVVEDVLNNCDVMCNMLDLKTYDDYTYYHSVNVAALSAVIGSALQMNRQELGILAMAAILHDVGKRFFDVEILNAKRKLTSEEMDIVKQHPKLGYDFLKENYDFPALVYTSILQHHEFFNGKGYPLGKEGKDIPIYARVIKIMDVYDALTSKRPYHDPMSPSEGVEYLMSRVGLEFDPDIVEVFLRKVAVYPVGCQVTLSNGMNAVVINNFPEAILRPRVKVIETNTILDLTNDQEARSITILKIEI